MPTKQSKGVTIPWQLMGIVMAILAGIIALYVQISEMKTRIDFLYQVEMSRYPRQGPPGP